MPACASFKTTTQASRGKPNRADNDVAVDVMAGERDQKEATARPG
jgi:hypothetical protein